jgi:hypothetical protein
MYALIELEDSEDMKVPAKLLESVVGLGLDVRFAGDILELLNLAGFEVENPEEFTSAKDAEEDIRKRYGKIRQELQENSLTWGTVADLRRVHIEKIQTGLLIDIAECLTFMTGVRH